AVLHPTPDHPVYFLPAVSAYSDTGGGYSAGEKHPSKDAISSLVVEVLAQENYRFAHPHVRFNTQGQVVYADGTPIRVPPRIYFDHALVFDRPGDELLTSRM